MKTTFFRGLPLDSGSLTQKQRVALWREAHQVLAERSKAGIIAYPAVGALLGFILGFENLSWVFYVACIGFVVLTLWRAYWVFNFEALYRKSGQRWFHVFALNLLLTAGSWGVFIGWTLDAFGLETESALGLMISAIISIVSVVIFAPHLFLARTFICATVLPVTAVLISLQERVALVVALATFVFIAYGFMLSLQLHKEFWRTLIYQRLLKERQADLSAAKESLQLARDELRQKVLQTEASLREREADYHRVFEGAHEAILVLDPESLRILEANPWASTTYGYDRSEIIGLSLEAITERLPQARANFERAMQSGGLHRFETQQIHRDGHRLLLEINTSVVEYQGQQALLCIHRDLTEQRRSEELRLAKEAAEQGSEAKGQFLANMSHEIRTPMGGILGVAALLRKADLGKRELGYVDLIEETAEGLLSLIDDILDFSRIEAGKLVLEHGPFRVHSWLEQIIALMLPPAQQKGLELSLQVGEDIPELLLGDSHRIRQVILNLLGNAIKFTEQGRVALAVDGLGCDASDPSGSLRLRFTVADTGLGISAQLQERLFETFTQADETMARRFGGAGLGLAICKRLVELMDGAMGFDSEVGLGSTFWFEIPIQLADETVGEPDLVRDRGSRLQRQDYNLLLAEDNEVNRLVAMAQLASLGYHVEAACDGFEVLERLEQKSFDLILMDCQMPGLDGYEATRRVRRESSQESLPIIALTAHAMAGDREKCLQAGMDDYLSKPFREKELAEMVDRWLAKGPSPTGRRAGDKDAQGSRRL